MGALEGKVVLVTGGANGIGRECALLAAREGARVVVNDLGTSLNGEADTLETASAQACVDEIRAAGGEAVANTESVTELAAANRMVELALGTFGRIDAVINPAGILRDRMLHKMSESEWDGVIEVHLRGAFNVSRAAIEHFRNKGSGAFVHFSSATGLLGNPAQANYAAAKLGVVGFSRALAMEGAAKNVRSNVIAPFAWTRMLESVPIRDEETAQRMKRLREGMRADQVSPLAIALISDEGAAVSGQVFCVRGNEVILFSQPRPVASVTNREGWSVASLLEGGIPALSPKFAGLDETSAAIFPYPPH
jgi:NAD(P)-dependent dehydrogenase (short-subunit alcohol dehydrogenase family)